MPDEPTQSPEGHRLLEVRSVPQWPNRWQFETARALARSAESVPSRTIVRDGVETVGEARRLAASGYELTELLIDALPSEDYDPAAYRLPSVTPTRVVDEGDVVTTGDRLFQVLHLPGHTPGEIGLWEAQSGSLFSGDCVYESGDLLDELPESNIPDYVRSMRRLRDLPVRVVHGGHDESFGRPRLLELIDGYVARRG